MRISWTTCASRSKRPRQDKTCGSFLPQVPNFAFLAAFRRREFRYGVAEGAGDALGEASVFGAFFFFACFSAAAFSASVMGPSFTVFASRLPSVIFQYEPRTSSFTVTSFIVAAAPALVSIVLLVILKTRDFSFPAIVKVFAF